jgi:glutathione peroxidase
VATDLYSFTVRTADGGAQPLADFRGKVVLVVNVASRCGFTPQYEGLQALHAAYRDRGFTVLGFPCNQFAGQEPGSDAEIQQFCRTSYDVEFPVMAKLEVNGAAADPLFAWLKRSAPGLLGTEAIKWNFTKFLVGRNGQVRARYATQAKPDSLRADIEKALAEPAPAG